jgi:hypothetical protein
MLCGRPCHAVLMHVWAYLPSRGEGGGEAGAGGGCGGSGEGGGSGGLSGGEGGLQHGGHGMAWVGARQGRGLRQLQERVASETPVLSLAAALCWQQPRPSRCPNSQC